MPEVGLMMGYVVDDTYWQYGDILHIHAPEIHFQYPFVPRLTVHTMSVLIAYRFDVMTYTHDMWLL